jgi:hydroxymethylbilane synthase
MHTKLPISEFPPSPGQGALGIVCRADDTGTLDMLKQIEDDDSRIAAESERTLSKFVESGCRFPVGAYGRVNGTNMTLTVVAYSIDGKKALVVEKTGSKDAPQRLGQDAAEELRQKGVSELAADWREKLEEWNR